MSKAMQGERRMWSKYYTYDEWMEAQGIPIYRGYYIEDLRTLQLGWWDARECNSAFIQLVGQEGVTSARVTEIPPGKTLPPIKFALDEIVYVVERHSGPARSAAITVGGQGVKVSQAGVR